MNETLIGSLNLNIEEASLLYIRLKRDENELALAERSLLRKLEDYLYGFLSIEELEGLVCGGKERHR